MTDRYRRVRIDDRERVRESVNLAVTLPAVAIEPVHKVDRRPFPGTLMRATIALPDVWSNVIR